MKSVASKMGTKIGMRAFFVNAPSNTIEDMELPQLDLASQLDGEFDYLHLFVKSQNEFIEQFPMLKAHLAPTGKLWVSWPKKGQEQTDLSIFKVIELGYNFGLVESTCLRINAVWSAIKFTHPKKGKVYHNKFGKLQDTHSY